jgi:glycosyltransferase involved in cell wall biosynthesis
MEKKTHILFVTNVDWFFVSHRLSIAENLIKNGFEVTLVCKQTVYKKNIESLGIKFINIDFIRSSTNVFYELRCIITLFNIYKNLKPDIVHHIALKPIIYGSIIAKYLKIKGVVNSVSGLGYNFIGNRFGLVRKIMIIFMRFGFKKKGLTIIFQNNDDHDLFKNLNIVSNRNRVIMIKGSGVDLNLFKKTPLPSFELIKVLLPCRMLWDKGIRELREATKILKFKYEGKVQFILCGSSDEGNKACVPVSYLKEWDDGTYVKWIGYQKSMVEIYQNSHIVVLPSYREGLPKSLQEACAIGRAIVTTNAPGCKDTVDENYNGFKVPVFNVQELANALEKLFLDHELTSLMSNNSREKAENEFDIKNVISMHLEIYNRLVIG